MRCTKYMIVIISLLIYKLYGYLINCVCLENICLDGISIRKRLPISQT